MITDITSDLGGVDNVSEAEKVLVRRAAMLTLQSEFMEHRFAETDGEATPRQLDMYQKTTNTLRRTLEALGLERRARDVSLDGLIDAVAAS